MFGTFGMGYLLFGMVYLTFGVFGIRTCGRRGVKIGSTSVECFVKVEGGGQKGDNWGRVEEDLKDPGQVWCVTRLNIHFSKNSQTIIKTKIDTRTMMRILDRVDVASHKTIREG